MNNEQRKFTVKKIEKYEELQATEKKRIRNNAYFAGFMALGLVLNATGVLSPSDNPIFPIWVSAIAGTINLVAGIGSLSSMISAMGKKAGISNILEYLNFHLDFNDLADKEENKGQRL